MPRAIVRHKHTPLTAASNDCDLKIDKQSLNNRHHLQSKLYNVAFSFSLETASEVFCHLKKLLEPLGIQKYCTDGSGSYDRSLSQYKHEIGKRKTQKIERKHLNLRAIIKRL
ncbi:IS1 family transposase [Microcoleus asticus]|uniref:IS1 family transposase n=1 Tax=Microcoleus asticus TaxID=2815231 RepID=UPI0015581EC3